MPKFRYHQAYKQEQIESEAIDRTLLKRLWSYLKPYKGWIFLAIFFLFISRALEAYVPIFIGKTTQLILNNVTGTEEAKSTVLSTVISSCIWITCLLALSYSLDALNTYIKSRAGQRALVTMRMQVYDHIQHLPLRYFDRHSVGRLMTRTIHDVEQINEMFTESVVPILGNIMLFICICIGMLVLNWRIAIAIACLLPLVFWLTNRFRSSQRISYERIRTIVSAMNTFVQEHLMGASTIRNFGLQEVERKQFEEINEDHCTAYMESIDHFSFFIASIDFLQSFALILAFIILFSFTPISQGFQAGTFFTFTLYAMMFFRPLADLAERYNVLQSAMAASERIFNVLDAAEENPNREGKELADIDAIAFEDVWFAYEKENWVLRGLSFQMKRGESIALVGVTGAGKTSILSLLLRFYEFQKGSIKINGVDIREYTLESVRRQFSVVLQDPVIFSGSIAENIALYRPLSPEQMQQVIDYMGMQSFVDNYPDGLQHLLTERGTSLSLGQMQLVSMARAIAQERSTLILDEATANIDSVTERIIQEALKKILRDKSAIVIAHRLSTIKDVNRIVVLHNGVVAEEGTHQQLLQLNGFYEKLYRLQFTEA